MSRRLPSLDRPDRAAVADYVAAIAGELADLARDTGLPTLSYILEMARLEAANETRNEAGRSGH